MTRVRGAALTLCVAALFAAAPAAAAEMAVEAAWARASAGAARAAAVYMTMRNPGPAQALVGAATPLAERAQLHTHIMDGDIARMRPVDRVALEAGGSVVFAPGGLHVMLFGLVQPLREGAVFPLTLHFEDGKSRTVDIAVGTVAAMAPPAGHHER